MNLLKILVRKKTACGATAVGVISIRNIHESEQLVTLYVPSLSDYPLVVKRLEFEPSVHTNLYSRAIDVW